MKTASTKQQPASRANDALPPLPSPLSVRLSALNARCNTALDAVAESLTFAVLAALCGLGRLKDRLLCRARSRAVRESKTETQNRKQ